MRFRGKRLGDKRVKRKFAFIPVMLDDVDEYVWLEYYYSHEIYDKDCAYELPQWWSHYDALEINNEWK